MRKTCYINCYNFYHDIIAAVVPLSLYLHQPSNQETEGKY